MRMWLDEVRPAPAGWHWARSADEAIDASRSGTVEEASFDHGLRHCSSCAACTVQPQSACDCRCHLSAAFVVNGMAGTAPDTPGSAQLRDRPWVGRWLRACYVAFRAP